MTQTLLLTKIEAAKQAISDAETELQNVVREGAGAPRAEKVEVSGVVRAAFSKLEATKAKLVDLVKLVELAKVDAAKTAILEAERDLDRVVDEIVIAARPEKKWVSGVAEALAKLRAAKSKLVDLEKSITNDRDPA